MLHNEWCVPYRLLDTLGMAVDTGTAPIPAGVNAYHERDGSRAFGDRGRTLFWLLLPAFRAGVHAFQRLSAQRVQFRALIDRAREGLVLLDVDGRVLHRNPALQHMLAGDPESERLTQAVLMLARSAAALARTRSARDARHTAPVRASARASAPDTAQALYRELRTARGRYRLSVTLLDPAVVDAAPSSSTSVLVSVEAATPHPLSGTELRARYGLSARETEVARLLARGFSTKELTHALGTSPHTARHHTERVLFKLGVHSRAAADRARRYCEYGYRRTGPRPVTARDTTSNRVSSRGESPWTHQA